MILLATHRPTVLTVCVKSRLTRLGFPHGTVSAAQDLPTIASARGARQHGRANHEGALRNADGGLSQSQSRTLMNEAVG